MKTKKIAIMLSIVLGCTTLFPSMTQASTYNGWSKSNDSWYYYSNGNTKTGWARDNGKWYYLDSNGVMATGWKNVNDTWYYLENSGAMATGWKYVDGAWYYLESSGAMAKGWKEVKGEKYYLSNSGAMVKGWQTIDNNNYYFFNNGEMAESIYIGNYYFDDNGIAKFIQYKGDSVNDSIDTSNVSNVSNPLNAFASKSSAMVLGDKDKNKNSIYSPESLYMALGVLSQGAGSDCQKDLLKSLNCYDSAKLSSVLKNAKKSAEFNDGDNNCIIGNSLWLDNDDNITFNDEVIDKISDDFSADIFKEDLQSDKTAEKKSEYVMSHTNNLLGKDKDSFKCDESQKMNIINTLYFKDKWREPFDKDNTKVGKFTLNNGQTVDTDFMNKSERCNTFEKKNEYKASSMGFKNGSSMVVILPESGKSPYDILNKNLNEALTSISSQDKATYKEVYYKVPKFKFNSDFNLNKSLEKMGLSSIFDKDKADFSKFSNNAPLFVSDVKQNACISIDEYGAEAAAVTAIDVRSVSVVENMKMDLDRPFIFAIMSKDDTPLFVGVINNPNDK